MKKTILLIFLSSLTHVAFSQLIWSYDFKNDTIGKKLEGHGGWSASTDKGYPGIGGCAGVLCEQVQVKKDTLEYSNYGSFYKALDIKRADGLGHFLNSTNNLPDTTFSPIYKAGEKVYAAYLVKFSSAPNGNDAQPSLGQIVRVYGKYKFGEVVGMRVSCTKKDTFMRFGLERNGGFKATDYKYAFNKTHLIVMRYTYIDSLNLNDEVALFVDPKLTAIEPTPDLVTMGGDDAFLNRFVFYLNNFNEIAIGSITGIKVYQKWNDVVSASVEVRNEVLSIRPTLVENFIELNLDKSYPSVSNIRVVDLQGREVLIDKVNVGELHKTLNTNGLTKGFYIVSIQNKDFIAAQKFVKN
jgi:Secretion system C-terminal sorting domain